MYYFPRKYKGYLISVRGVFPFMSYYNVVSTQHKLGKEIYDRRKTPLKYYTIYERFVTCPIIGSFVSMTYGILMGML